MGFLSDNFPAFGPTLMQMDRILDENSPLDKKTDELLRFALSIKARSRPCVRKHYRGSIKAGATKAEIAFIFALTMREAAGADDCWTHSVIGDLVDDVEAGGSDCTSGCS